MLEELAAAKNTGDRGSEPTRRTPLRQTDPPYA